jgi:hypothetical protein
MQIVRIRRFDDWVEIYFEDELIFQNHSIHVVDLPELMEKLGFEVEVEEVEDISPPEDSY